MGINCSCIYSTDQEKLLTIEKTHSEAKQDADNLQNSLKLSEYDFQDISIEIHIQEEDIIVLQSIFRGFIERKKIKDRLKFKSTESYLTKIKITKKSSRNTPEIYTESQLFPLEKQKRRNSRNNIEAKQNRVDIIEISDNMLPDYLTPSSKQIQTKLGLFIYQQKNKEKDLLERGPVRMENGAIYAGCWNNQNQRHGRGTQIWTDGSIYEGNWENDKANGKGRLIHGNGDYYEGEWKDDQANAFGLFVYSDGATYEGSWENNKYHGKGIEILPDGTKYEGMFANGLKHGFGKIEWADLSNYEGEFFENNIEGIGTYLWNDGRKFVGDWKENKMHGKGMFTWKDGKSYEGDFFNDKKQGFGIFIWPDGRKHEGEWFDGKQHGKGIFTINAVTREGIWDNGKRIIF